VPELAQYLTSAPRANPHARRYNPVTWGAAPRSARTLAPEPGTLAPATGDPLTAAATAGTTHRGQWPIRAAGAYWRGQGRASPRVVLGCQGCDLHPGDAQGRWARRGAEGDNGRYRRAKGASARPSPQGLETAPGSGAQGPPARPVPAPPLVGTITCHPDHSNTGRVRQSAGHSSCEGSRSDRDPHPKHHSSATAGAPASTPPSMTMLCPVVKLPAGEARNTAAPAISSGSPMRCSGVSRVRLR